MTSAMVQLVSFDRRRPHPQEQRARESASKDPSKKLTTHFVSARFEDLSPEVVEAVKMTVLDTAGAALAGSSSAAGRGIARIAQRYGGGTGSTLLAHGGRVAAPMAALANGVMARCCVTDTGEMAPLLA